MGKTDKDFVNGESGKENGGEVLCGGGASGTSIWVRYVGTDPRLEKSFKGFHYREVRWMVGMLPKHQQDGTWVYTTIGKELAMVGME